MSQLMDSTKHGNVAFPELAICCTAGHGTEQEVVDLNDFSDLVG